MKHCVITIGCEYGSGGPEIGEMLAKSLDIKYYDRELIDKVVEETGVEKELVEAADEKVAKIRYSFETKFGPRYGNLTNKVISAQFKVIHDFAEESSCVIIGRCSDYILQDREDVLNIFIYAPLEDRIENIMKMQNVSRKEAEEMIKYHDDSLHARYKYVTGTYRGDRHNRHMLIDSTVLGWEATAEYMKQLIEIKFNNRHLQK